MVCKNRSFTIKNSTKEDIDEIFRLYRIATEYQKSKPGVILWPEFERSLVSKEIEENHQWKLLIDNKIACIWATTFTDEKIWEEKNQDAAVYIHRIVTNPDFKGNNLIKRIVEWAKNYARQQTKDYIRLDTIGHNVPLIEHYKKAGFNFLGIFTLKNPDGLPDHYHKAPACLFEIKLNE